MLFATECPKCTGGVRPEEAKGVIDEKRWKSREPDRKGSSQGG
jgi:hypothetical protein